MEGLDRLGIARALREMARLHDLAGDEAFKARAYARGATVLEGLDDLTFERLLSEERLTALQGIGAGLAARITELRRTGRAGALETLRAQLPPGASELARLGLPLAQIAALHRALGVETIADLRTAAQEGPAAGEDPRDPPGARGGDHPPSGDRRRSGARARGQRHRAEDRGAHPRDEP